ncbi:MAG: FG-GAP repeat domain-containing protein, partial [Blastocatellia bacterium]
MQSRIPRILLFVFFIALLAFPLVYKRIVARNEGVSNASTTPATALSRYGFILTESAKASGIGFKHTAPTLDAKLGHIMEQVASMGAAVSVSDFDRDGWQDLYVTNSSEGSRNALYKNLRDGSFKDVAAEAGLDGLNSRE